MRPPPRSRAAPKLRRRLSRRAVLNLIATVVVPIGAYLSLHQALGRVTPALAVSEGIPVVWLSAVAVWRRRLEPLALLTIVVFGVALVVTLASGGSALPLKLRRAPAT